RLRDLHAATRKRFEQEVADVPIIRRAFRLRRLQKIHDQALASGNAALALHTLEQAAKEVGGMFTNSRVPSRKAKKPARRLQHCRYEQRNHSQKL
ncbi:DUF2280 domain-containing protein, partial [Novosphingobium sp. AAP83]|uniref:DUF2280 domain-containing protein n=1 Tax=Novosphingobium sp. AAP83 TaxID=1523425 RepID=UPI0012F97A4C